MPGRRAAATPAAARVRQPMARAPDGARFSVPMLLSMIGGLFVFGLAGFFVGPVVLSATIVLLHIWHQRAGSGEAPPDRHRAARDEL